MQHEVGKHTIFLLILLQQFLQFRDGQAVEVEVVVLVVELVVVEGVDGAGVLSDHSDGVPVAVERFEGLFQILDVAVSRVVVQPAILLQSL